MYRLLSFREKHKYDSLKSASKSVKMTEPEGESGDSSGPNADDGAAVNVEDPPKTGSDVEGVGENETNRSPVQTKDQDSEPDDSTSPNETRETMELVGTEGTCKEIETHPRKKRRRSSVVFAFFPGRKDSMIPLVLAVSRSQRSQTQHRFGRLQPSPVVGSPVNTGEAGSLQPEELDDMESMNSSDRIQLIHHDSEESTLVGNDSIRAKFSAKLKKFKYSVILSLKDLKYFMR